MKTFIDKKEKIIKQSINKSVKKYSLTLLYTFLRDGDFYFLNILKLQQLKKKNFSVRIYQFKNYILFSNIYYNNNFNYIKLLIFNSR